MEEGCLQPTWADKLLIGVYTGPAVGCKLQQGLGSAAHSVRDEGDKAFNAAEGGIRHGHAFQLEAIHAARRGH